MTSHVKVSAHCAANKQVRVAINNGGRSKEVKYLNDGEEMEFTVHDDLEVSVKEWEIEASAAAISDGGGQYPDIPKKP